jgi:hypothetical protein
MNSIQAEFQGSPGFSVFCPEGGQFKMDPQQLTRWSKILGILAQRADDKPFYTGFIVENTGVSINALEDDEWRSISQEWVRRGMTIETAPTREPTKMKIGGNEYMVVYKAVKHPLTPDFTHPANALVPMMLTCTRLATNCTFLYAELKRIAV